MEAIRTFFEKPILILRSKELVDECAALVRTGSGKVESAGSAADDRVMALAIALIIYVDHVIYKFGGAKARLKYSYNSEEFVREREKSGEEYKVGDLIHDRLMLWREKVSKT